MNKLLVTTVIAWAAISLALAAVFAEILAGGFAGAQPQFDQPPNGFRKRRLVSVTFCLFDNRGARRVIRSKTHQGSNACAAAL
jgi:hypothetical protein